jgi:hypothetical protein
VFRGLNAVSVNSARLWQKLNQKIETCDVMKTVVKIFVLGVLTVLLAIAANAKPVKEPLPKNKNLMSFKADKKFIGARVEILQENGSRIAEQILEKRKILIDFNGMREGVYTVRLVKGNDVKEFTFEKK